ncbi:hypothetical protein CU100_24275 [Phyllobacterium endophyticum]|uniref:Uncharacterized protein n=1 Tax=Phyllobacterium endophyticum TaxID=1149773 RepID=A0A2P7ALX0_9HYPH|nr:hypothetical protein CU100_24275 [Phyllobacterium endophyticum]
MFQGGEIVSALRLLLRQTFCGERGVAVFFAGDHTRVGTCHAIIVGRDFVLASWPLASFSGLLLAWAGGLSGMNSSSAMLSQRITARAHDGCAPPAGVATRESA